MTKSIMVKHIKIGEGIPKVCVPITGTKLEDIISQTEMITTKEPDLVEWRVDFFDEVMHFEAVEQALCEIVQRLNKIPLIFTFRTKAEGGERGIGIVDYIDLNLQVASTKLVDLIDLELLTCGDGIDEVTEEIQYTGTKVVASYHNFDETPAGKEIIDIMQQMADANADILKVAVMPKAEADVDTLIDATFAMRAKTDKPLVALSMGERGVRTRINAEAFGSAITFASVIKASAPGQVEFDKLKNNLQEVHRNLQQ